MTTTPDNGANNAPAEYTNPVIDRDFPDPCIFRDGDIYYAYATNSAGQTMPCARSADLIHWSDPIDAMPHLPPWTKLAPGMTWAPHVRKFGETYVAHFTARDKVHDTQAIGTAISASPEGPFTSSAETPFISQPDLGGCIDPTSFVDDDGAHYLIWKNDGNSRGQDTWLWIQSLSSGGLKLQGEPQRLIKQDQSWEGSLIEGPTVWKYDGKYYLFYSANDYGNCNYAMGYAVADSVTGPYVKPRQGAWVASTSQICGPGGEDIMIGPDGETWMVYHMWQKGPHSYRSMAIARLAWRSGVPYLLVPSDSSSPLDSTRNETPDV